MYKKKSLISPIYTYCKKHNCLKCESIMKPVRASKIVNSDSEEAKYFDFGGVDYNLKGDVEFSWGELRCEYCGFHIKNENLRTFERLIKKLEKQKGQYGLKENVKYVLRSIDNTFVSEPTVCKCDNILSLDYIVIDDKYNVEIRELFLHCSECNTEEGLSDLDIFITNREKAIVLGLNKTKKMLYLLRDSLIFIILLIVMILFIRFVI